MANTTIYLQGPKGPVEVLAVDNGDDTWSLGVSSAGGGGDPVTIAGPLGRAADAASVSVALSTEVVALLGRSGTYTERSSTITLGGTAQEAMAANASRKDYFLQNISAGDIWFSFVETAAVDGAGSVKLSPGASAFSAGGFVSTQALSIIGATTGQKFTLWEG